MISYIKDKIKQLGPSVLDSRETRQGGVSIGAGWLVKAAFPLLTGVVILWVVLTCLIHYPEIVKARAIMTRTEGNGAICLVNIDPPQNNWFRIDSGQMVQLQFDEYQYGRYGYLRGVLGHVSYSEGRKDLKAWVYLPAGFTTNKDQPIPFKPDMKADILITIKDMMLWQRIFYNSAKKSFH